MRLISAVQEAISSSIEPERRNLFHRFFFTQRFMSFSTSEMALHLYDGHKPDRLADDTVPLTCWPRR